MDTETHYRRARVPGNVCRPPVLAAEAPSRRSCLNCQYWGQDYQLGGYGHECRCPGGPQQGKHTHARDVCGQWRRFNPGQRKQEKDAE